MSDFIALLLEKLGDQYPVNEYMLRHLERHFLLLEKWNRKMNLTAIEGVEEIVVRHYCESIALGFVLPFGKLHIIDAGSGAGFPGIPLAITRPDCFVYLVESDTRKAVFLRESALQLRNVRVIRSRLADVIPECDWLVSRGVAWEDLWSPAERLASHVALMTTTDCLETISSTPGITWHEPIAMAWGSHRVVLLGDLPGAIVSRETSTE